MKPGFDNFFEGKLVRLGPPIAADAAVFARWSANVEYSRLIDDDPAYPRTAQFFEKDVIAPHAEPGEVKIIDFMIRTLAEDKLIGFVALHSFNRFHQTATVSIGIGEPDYWGKGYGTEALSLMVAYAFRELNLYRVGLSVFSYNARAIKSYEKVGFVREGAIRGLLQRDGQRYDSIMMGILRDEWFARNRGPSK